MPAITLKLTTRDPLAVRDGRPLGAGWPLPSVLAGSFRTALVKADPSLSFEGDMPQRLRRIEVAGGFPVAGREMYLPAPHDCLWDAKTNRVHRLQPLPLEAGEGADFPSGGLDPVMLAEDQAKTDFKPKPVPAWWPMGKLSEWLLGGPVRFDKTFLNAAAVEIRDRVGFDAESGAAKGRVFDTAGLNATHLPRYGVAESRPFRERFGEIALSVRVTIAENAFGHVENLSLWHPLGGERRLVHWGRSEAADSWTCPASIRAALETASRIRMVLATPAIFDHGWRPGWLDASTLEGRPVAGGPTLRLVGVSHRHWRAVSGWSLAPPRGPKAIRRMVPAGGVYFFQVKPGEAAALADKWLHPVSDKQQDCNDGFGLAVWGSW